MAPQHLLPPSPTSALTPHATFGGYRGIGSLAPYELVNLDAGQLDLDNCGFPHLRRPDLYVEFPVSYVYQLQWTLAGYTQWYLDERRPISAKGDFILDRVCGLPIDGLGIRFMWPNGRFSANVRIPTTKYFGQGDTMAQFVDGVVIEAGQWIGIEAEIALNTASNIFTMSFDGRMRYYLHPNGTR